jgi:hypothetical protein
VLADRAVPASAKFCFDTSSPLSQDYLELDFTKNGEMTLIIATPPQQGVMLQNYMRKENEAKSVVMADRIIGCPHEEGVDYPDGSKCPQCPFWAIRDRFTGDIIQ